MGYDNWNLGYTTVRRLYTLETISQCPEVEWYAEKVRHGPERKVMWKAFISIVVKVEEIHEVYVQAAKERLEECRAEIQEGVGNLESVRRNVQVYEKLIAEESSKPPVDLLFDQW